MLSSCNVTIHSFQLLCSMLNLQALYSINELFVLMNYWLVCVIVTSKYFSFLWYTLY